jgi:hypothetical protein
MTKETKAITAMKSTPIKIEKALRMHWLNNGFQERRLRKM